MEMEAPGEGSTTSDSPTRAQRKTGFRPNLAPRKSLPTNSPSAPFNAGGGLPTNALISVAGKRKESKDKEKETDEPTPPQQKKLKLSSSSGPTPILSARSGRTPIVLASPTSSSSASSSSTSSLSSSSSPSSGGPPPIKTTRATTLKDVVRANVGAPMRPSGTEEQVRSIKRPMHHEASSSTSAAPAMGPQVTIDPETGEIVIDKQSLVVNSVQREESGHYDVVYEDQEAKNANFQRHRRKVKREKWNREQTDKFYQALRRYGTDFTLIAMLFPGRTRDQIRNKFKKEEKENGGSIDLALKDRLPIENDEHKMLSEMAKRIADEEKRVRELRENGEFDIPPATLVPITSGQPQQRKTASIIAPASGPSDGNNNPEATTDGANSTTAANSTEGEIVIDRSEYEAQNQYSDDEGAYDAGRYDDDDDYGGYDNEDY